VFHSLCERCLRPGRTNHLHKLNYFGAHQAALSSLENVGSKQQIIPSGIFLRIYSGTTSNTSHGGGSASHIHAYLHKRARRICTHTRTASRVIMLAINCKGQSATSSFRDSSGFPSRSSSIPESESESLCVFAFVTCVLRHRPQRINWVVTTNAVHMSQSRF